jgi:hypothetical protein
MIKDKPSQKPSKKPEEVKKRRKAALRMHEVEKLPLKAIAKNLGMSSRGGAYGLIQDAKRVGITI